MTDRFNISRALMLLVFLPALLMQSWKTPLAYLWYFANQEAITEQFCINKNKPELKCNGKCHIQKVIKEYESPEEDKNSLIPEFIDERTFVLIEKYSPDFPLFEKCRIKKSPFIYLFNYSHTIENMVFYPPELLS